MPILGVTIVVGLYYFGGMSVRIITYAILGYV